MTPAAHVESVGSQSNAPTTTSDPLGSLTTDERKESCSVRNCSSLSASGPRPRSGPPSTTRRVGSPPVWESITFTLRIMYGLIDSVQRSALSSQLLATPPGPPPLPPRVQNLFVIPAKERPADGKPGRESSCFEATKFQVF